VSVHADHGIGELVGLAVCELLGTAVGELLGTAVGKLLGTAVGDVVGDVGDGVRRLPLGRFWALVVVAQHSTTRRASMVVHST
jgi:hypothetical protein